MTQLGCARVRTSRRTAPRSPNVEMVKNNQIVPVAAAFAGATWLARAAWGLPSQLGARPQSLPCPLSPSDASYDLPLVDPISRRLLS